MLTINLSVRSLVRNVALVLLGMLTMFVIQPRMAPIATAQITSDGTQALGNVNQAPGTSTWVSCVPVGIMTYSSRVHVQCQTAISGINYFAASTSNASNAARILSVITAAQVAGRTLSVLYDPADTSGASIGCEVNSCRLIQAVGFGQ